MVLPDLIHYAMFKSFLLLLCLISVSSLTSCVVKQTTTRNGEVIDEKYVVKRPVKKFVETVEFE